MEAVTYSAFRNHLKSYLRKTHDDAEPLLVTNTNPEDNVVVMNVRDYESLLETVRIYANPELHAKIKRGMAQAERGQTVVRELATDD